MVEVLKNIYGRKKTMSHSVEGEIAIFTLLIWKYCPVLAIIHGDMWNLYTALQRVDRNILSQFRINFESRLSLFKSGAVSLAKENYR